MITEPCGEAVARRASAADVPACGLLVLGVVGGCGSAAAPRSVAGLAEARLAWNDQGTTDYTFTLESTCGERALIGLFAVTVVGGEVAGLEGLDEPGRRNAQLPTVAQDVPDVGGLLERLADLEPAQVREAQFDETTGMPTHVVIDPLPGAVDDEECYDLSSYVAAP